MRIIHKGIKPEERVYKGHCILCSTEFEFQRKEADREVHDQRDGNAMVVICPTCGRECWINI